MRDENDTSAVTGNVGSGEMNVKNNTSGDTGETNSGEESSGEGDEGEDNSGEMDDGGTGSGGTGGREEEKNQSHDGDVIDDEVTDDLDDGTQINRQARSTNVDVTLCKNLTLKGLARVVH